MNVIRKLSYIPIYLKVYLGLLRIIIFRVITFGFSKPKNQWVILERGYDAQDNAWHFFKYMVQNHPEITVKYAIKKSSPDYARNLIGYENNVIEYNSYKYYRYLFNSVVIISTHINTYTPKLAITTALQKTIFKYEGKIVFLQHGIIHQPLQGLMYPNHKIDLFISGAVNEYDFLTNTYGYPNGIIQYTGLARYDNLLNFQSKKQILVMPTWRSEYLSYNDTQFIETPFFQNYNTILSSKHLQSLLEQYDYNLIFYNHFEFQRFNHLFEKKDSGRVRIVKFGQKKVQDLMKESDIVITDYSSIYYDVLYMQKPLIFFQFDKDYFDTHHYGYNNDNIADFGILTTTPTETVAVLSHLINTGCTLDKKFVRKAQNVFTYHDTNNCQRIFEAINKLFN